MAERPVKPTPQQPQNLNSLNTTRLLSFFSLFVFLPSGHVWHLCLGPFPSIPLPYNPDCTCTLYAFFHVTAFGCVKPSAMLAPRVIVSLPEACPRPRQQVAESSLAMVRMQALLTHCVLALSLGSSSAAEISCGECCIIQEIIQRSIDVNISALEKQALSGTTTTATLEIGQIIWHVCGSDAWKGARYKQSLTSACKRFVKQHVDLATNYWKEKPSEDYKDPLIALSMKRAVCTNPDVGACTLDALPSPYSPLRPDECAVCQAMVSDIFGMVAASRDRPTEGKRSDAYYRLAEKLPSVCAELPMRHALGKRREEVNDACDELWDDHEAKLLKLALLRDEAYARSLCADELEVCDEPMTRAELYPTGVPDASKDEM